MLSKEQIVSDSKEFSLFSWSAQASANPIAIERAEGVYLYDYDGTKIIDFTLVDQDNISHKFVIAI